MPEGLQDHPLRAALIAEVHARPFAELQAPARVAYFAMLSGEDGADADYRYVAALFESLGRPMPDPAAKHAMADFGSFHLKWERHTEFSSYTIAVPASPEAPPFSGLAVEALPADWLASLPGRLMVALRIDLLSKDSQSLSPAALASFFAVENFAGGTVSGGSATAWMDFAVDSEGYGRALIEDRGLRPRQAGRLVQRLCEIETYRMMSLLAFPLAQSHGPDLSRIEERLTDLAGRIGRIQQLADERRLLQDLTDLSAEIEQIAVATNYRFGAARAYYTLVRTRSEQLRTQRLEGYQSFTEFLDRRLAPAMGTCESMAGRIDLLSKRISRAGQLLRTRVDIELEAQNQTLLISMDRRAQMQLRLQETVEGLSAVAITYYLVGLVNYLAKALKGQGLAISTDSVTGLAIPLVFGLVWMGVRRVRRQVAKASAAPAPGQGPEA